MATFQSFVELLDMANFSKQLKQLRTDRKLTQLRLAELLKVNHRVYNRWESGEASPHLDTLVKIADILDVSLDELTGRQKTTSDTQIHNHELHRLYQKVDRLSDEDQQALIVVLDSLIKRTNMQQIMGE